MSPCHVVRGRSGSLFVGSKGFSNASSQASSLTPRNSLKVYTVTAWLKFHNSSKGTPSFCLKVMSGLEEEMARFRRLHHTRAVNARIKAVRSGGKRHPPCTTLKERMDQEAMIRKEQALAYVINVSLFL